MRFLALILAVALVAVLGLAVMMWETPTQPPLEPDPPPTTGPATQPVDVEDIPEPPPPPATLLDVVRLTDPGFPTTQPLDFTVKFAESAKLILDLPLYIDPRGDLWITHPDAASIAQTLAQAGTHQTHVVADRVAHVRWLAEAWGTSRPHVVIADPDGGFTHIAPGGARSRLPREDYLWTHAMEWQDAVIVPTPTGVSVLRFTGSNREQHFDFAEAGLLPEASSIPQLVEDTRGLLAFIPWDGDQPGSTAVARYLDGEWTRLPQAVTGERTVHLIPLLDGSLIRLSRIDENRIGISRASLETIDAPRDRILALVDQLSDLEQDNRDAAMEALRAYGQGIAPILEELVDDQPPEARIRIRQILKDRIVPTLSGMTVIEDRLAVVHRQPDRTVLLFATQGISMPDARDELQVVSPAWLAIGPQTGIRLLDQRMTNELLPDRSRLQWVKGDWVVSDAARGLRMWVGNTFVPLLDEAHRDYRHVLGVDRTGRWIFHRAPPLASTLLPQRDLLVLDRRLPDPTPRLPVWVWSEPNATVGWDKDGWPAMRAGGAFALDRTEWRGFNPDDEPFITDPADARPRPATSPTTRSTFGDPLLIALDGTQYFGGNDQLIVVTANGMQTTWRLPPQVTGDAPPHLVQTDDGRLYLFNQAGRIVRLAPTPDDDQPFTVEAVFTRRIPNRREITRMWLDPAGRLILLAGPHELAICFPEGRIPRPIANLMPAEADDEQW